MGGGGWIDGESPEYCPSAACCTPSKSHSKNVQPFDRGRFEGFSESIKSFTVAGTFTLLLAAPLSLQGNCTNTVQIEDGMGMNIDNWWSVYPVSREGNLVRPTWWCE